MIEFEVWIQKRAHKRNEEVRERRNGAKGEKSGRKCQGRNSRWLPPFSDMTPAAIWYKHVGHIFLTFFMLSKLFSLPYFLTSLMRSFFSCILKIQSQFKMWMGANRVDVSWKYAWATIGIFRCALIGNMGGRQLELYMPWHRYFAYTCVLILFCKHFSPFNVSATFIRNCSWAPIGI